MRHITALIDDGNRALKIVVLMKQVPDTEEERVLNLDTGILDRTTNDNVADEITERALEVALSFRDANKGTQVVVLSVGPETAAQALRKGLQMGADSAVHVVDAALAGADAVQTAHALAAAARQTGFDLLVAGNESTDGRGGVIPAMVSELLGVPLLGSLNEVTISAGTVSGQRREEAGTSTVHASLPAIISVTERSAEARFPNFKGIMTAKRKPLEVFNLAALSAGPEVGNSNTKVLSTTKRPARTAGQKIFDEGDAGVKLAEFLAAGHNI